MTNLHDILEKLRGAGQRLPPNEAAVLFGAAVRLAAQHGATLRPRLVQIDDSGVLHVLAYDELAPELEPGYLAPELLQADPPRKTEPRVQVYAAGALGFELFTGHRPPGNVAELTGPLADILRMALAPDRRERFGDLGQLNEAVESVQPRPPAEGERNIFNALRTRWSRPAPEKEAVARIIEKLTALEAQVGQLAKAQAKLDAAQRETAESLERFEDGQHRMMESAARRTPSAILPALLAGILAAAAVVAAGWALGMISAPAKAPPPEPQPPAPMAVAPPAPAAEVPDAAVAQAPVDAGAPLAAEPVDAGAVAVVDAGVPPLAALAPVDAGAPPVAPPIPKRPKAPEISEAQLTHAVAMSQVKRGEAALEHGNADEALASFRNALEDEPGLPQAWRGLGMAYAVQGNDAQALQAYEKYLQAAPNASDKAEIRKSMAELKARSAAATK